MPNNVQSSYAPSVLFASSSIAGAAAIGLLIGGTVAHHTAVLAWGVVAGGICVALSCMVAMRSMIDRAVDRCVVRLHEATKVEIESAVTDTAVKVGMAIAQGLADDAEVPRPRGVVSLR